MTTRIPGTPEPREIQPGIRMYVGAVLFGAAVVTMAISIVAAIVEFVGR